MFAVIVLLLVVSSNIGSVKSSLTVQRSQVVLIGERVEMKCRVTGSDLTMWMYTSWNTSHETCIYLNTDGNIVESMRSRYKIDKRISGQHNLIIDSVDFAHAGRYKCSGAVQGTLWSDVQLTVLYGPRNLRIVEYEDRLECSADGNPTPTYRWTHVDIKNSIEGHVIMLADKGQILQCTATNAFATEKKNFTVTNDFMVDKTSTKESSFQPHQSSKKLSSPQPTDEYAEIERADATDNTYCALADQPTTA